jgi:hypothetical protein
MGAMPLNLERILIMKAGTRAGVADQRGVEGRAAAETIQD